MSWSRYSIMTEFMKKKLCTHLIERYFGKFLEEKLTTDQLTLNLTIGNACLNDIRINVQALNEMSEKYNWPMEFVDGHIKELQMEIPWISLLKDSVFLEIRGLKITLQAKQQKEDAASMFESMWSSMTSSLRIVEEQARPDPEGSNAGEQCDTVTFYSSALDFFVRKIRVKFIDSVIQIEHVPKDSLIGVGIIVNIDLISYFDEEETEAGKEADPQQDSENAKKPNVVQSFTTKNLNIQGVTISTVEFPSIARTFSRSVVSDNSQESDCDSENESLEGETKPEDETDQSQSSIIDDVDDDENLYEDQRHKILFAKSTKEHIVKIRMNQSDGSEPKVSFQVILGHFILFLSPRQVQLLSEFVEGLASPDSDDHNNVGRHSRYVEKPITELDYQRIEYDLQQQMRSPYLYMPNLQATHGWSEAPLEEYSTENFYPMNSTYNSGTYESIFGGSLESSLCSASPSIASTEFSGHTRRKSRGSKTGSESTGEICTFNVEIASLGVILLHEDIINLNMDGHTLLPTSVAQMQKTAQTFFTQLENCEFLDTIQTNFDKASAKFSESCKLNHLRILGAPIRFDAKERTIGSSFFVSICIEATKFELVENLFERSRCLESVPLLRFKERTSSDPQVTIRLKYNKKTVPTGLRKNCPRTDINISLADCSAEFDVTIVDRISALLYSPQICVREKINTHNPWAADHSTFKNKSQQSVTDLKIESSCMDVKIRFPIVDFRPMHDPNRTPWWKRHVRPDYLHLTCRDISFQTTFSPDESFSEYVTQCQSVDVYYRETEKYAPVHIARVEYDVEDTNSMEEVSNHPRISVKIFPTVQQETQEQEDIMTQSLFNPSFLMNLDNGPFTSKKVIHQSNTLYENERRAGQELIVPGDKEEIEEFKKLTSESTKMLIDIMLPSIKMQLISKHIYELIYNRINNGLLLWEPHDPQTKPKFSQHNETYYNMLGTSSLSDDFKAPNASESDNEEDDGALLFYSTFDRPKSSASHVSEVKEISRQSKVVLNLQISRGILSFNTPVRDTTSNNVIPEQVGDFLLNVDKSTIFVVNGYKGDKELGYVCVQIDGGELSHCAMMSSSNIRKNLPNKKDADTHILPTIYKSEKGMLAEVKHGSTVRDMFTVACKIETKHETHPVKILKVSVGVNQGTLRHRMCAEPNSWISQMLDFFNVTDYPIPGYTSKEVVTELHLHMWDCAIDYRPLYLPLRSAITIGSFSMTSNMADKKNTSILRFIAQECNLYLSEKAPPKNGVPSNVRVHIKKDYVNVVSMGLFDLSLRISEKDSVKRPYIDMRIANDCVHIYTCSDSGNALTQLITYLASDGDFKSNETEQKVDNTYSRPKTNRNEQQLICMEQQPRTIRDITQLSKQEYEHVDKLLESALYDETEIKKSEQGTRTTPKNASCSSSILDPYHQESFSMDNIARHYQNQFAKRHNVAHDGKSQQSSYTDELINKNPSQYSATSSTKRNPDDTQLTVEELSLQYKNALIKRQHEHVDNLLEEVLYDEDTAQLDDDSPPRIFYIPDEPELIRNNAFYSPYPQIRKELGDITKQSIEEDIGKDFCFIDKEKDLGFSSGYRNPKIHTHGSLRIEVDDRHFAKLLEKIDKLETPPSFPVPKYKYTLCKMNIVWHMYGGNDFVGSNKEKKSKKVNFSDIGGYDTVNFRNKEEVVFAKSSSHAKTFDFKSWKTKGGVNRDHKVLMELELNKVQFQYDIYPKTTYQSSRQILLIHELEIRDLLAKSEFNKFLYQYTSVDKPRESLGQMVLIEAIHIRPDSRLPTEECCLSLSLLPLRFNIDQDSLKFLINFFTELGQVSDGECSAIALSSKKGIDPGPILTVNIESSKTKEEKQSSTSEADDNLIIFTDHFGNGEEKKPKFTEITPVDVDTSSNPIFFRDIIFNPDVLIKIDYQGKRVELADGSLFSLLVGLIMGMGQLNCSELKLKSICYRNGVLGADKVLSLILQEWLNDIKKNQMPSLLSGIGPLYSIVQLCQGVKDFFWMPIEQYKKDGRIFRGFRRGLNSLSTSTAMATLELTTRFLYLIQFTAEIAYDMLSPNPCVKKALKVKGRRKRYNQPQDLRDGVTNACLLFKHGMGETAESLAQAICFDSEQMSYTRAVGGVLRQIPPTVLKPIILASEASTNVLGGIKYQLLPDARNEANQKWRCKDE